MKFFSKFLFLTVFGSLALVSCDNDENTTPEPEPALDRSEVVSTYSSMVFAGYQDAMIDAQNLEQAINTFVADPTESNFEMTKEMWLVSRESYGPTEAFRFANGPIDAEDGPEGLLNAWPLDEVYVDYVEDAPNAGIINDLETYPTLDKALLESLNEAGGEANISIGYHAIEFLLWGQDLTDPSEMLPGQRKYTDFVSGENGTASNQDRRRQYLVLCADLLTDHLQLMIDQWTVGGPYRSTIDNANVEEVLSNMLTAIATLSKSELGGERMFVAYDNQDQEDEHSCFSDNTDRDIRLNLDGIANVYRGSYKNISGVSLEDLIKEADPSLGDEVSAALVAAETAVYATANPFDFAIFDGAERPKVLAAVTALQTLGDKLVQGAAALGLSITTD
jgi:putative iron-regulated protein